MKVRKRAIVFMCMSGPFRDNSDKLEPGMVLKMYCTVRFSRKECVKVLFVIR